MFDQSEAFRVMAAKYLRLAKGTEDPRERSKFFDYAMLYAQLSQQSERRKTSRAMAGGDVERRHASERGDVVARSHGR
jgi:hypothetical protein